MKVRLNVKEHYNVLLPFQIIATGKTKTLCVDARACIVNAGVPIKDLYLLLFIIEVFVVYSLDN